MKSGIIFRGKELQETDDYVGRLRISVASSLNPVSSLSGGNQQKAVIAKWLFADSEIVIFDEPTRGIDVGAKTEIYNIINRLVLNGKSVLVISSELPELLGICTRILTISQGRITGEFPNRSDQEVVLKAMCMNQRKRQ